MVFYAERSDPGICRLSEAFLEAAYRCTGRDDAAFFGVNAGAVRIKLIGIDSKGILCYDMNQIIYRTIHIRKGKKPCSICIRNEYI